RHIRRRAARERPNRLKPNPDATRAIASVPSLVEAHCLNGSREIRPRYSRRPRETRNQFMPRDGLRRVCLRKIADHRSDGVDEPTNRSAAGEFCICGALRELAGCNENARARGIRPYNRRHADLHLWPSGGRMDRLDDPILPESKEGWTCTNARPPRAV